MIDDDRAAVLLRLLRAEPGFENAELDGPPEQLTGGFWASISRLRFTGVAPPDDTLVLRVMPDDAMAAKETVFQTEISRQGYPVPRVRLSGGRSAGLRGPYLLMDNAPGRPPLAGLDGLAALRQLPSIARNLPRLLGQATARLHTLDPQPLLAALRAASATAPAGTREFLAALTGTAAALDRPDLLAAAHWLAQHLPPDGPAVICHGDLHPFNLLVDAGRWTLLDWTAAAVSDPAYDLAFTGLMLRHPPLVAPRPLRPAINAAGAFLASRFLAAYRHASGTLPASPTLEWFTSLHALRILLEIESWAKDPAAIDRSGHPWTAMGPVAARLLARATAGAAPGGDQPGTVKTTV